MITRRLSLVVLGVAASLAWMGCQPAVQPPVGNQKDHPAVQEKGGPTVVRFTAADDVIRVRLLMLETVQTDLGLTADQIGKLRDVAETSKERWRELPAKLHEIFPPSQSFPQEELEAREQEFQALSEELRSKGKELRTKVLAMLTPSQSERLKQIQIQATIPAALARPEIIKVLDISEEQLATIRAMREHMDQKQSAEWTNLRGLNSQERPQKEVEFMKALDEAQAEATKRILDVLTPEQRTKFEKLQGNKIDVTWRHDALTPEDAELLTSPEGVTAGLPSNVSGNAETGQ